MKVYTYFNNIGFEHQDELLNLWKLSWSKQGYSPVVLSQKDAESHPLFNEFKSKIEGFHQQIMNQNIGQYGLACWLRWLAYATLSEGKFYVTDYDVINHNFPLIEPDDQLHFLNGCCPCAASGNASQFNSMCEQVLAFVKHNLSSIIEVAQNERFVCFHDQEFMLVTHLLKKKLFKMSEDRLIRFSFPEQSKFWEKQLVHYSTFSCKLYCQQKNIKFDKQVRCEIAQRHFLIK